MNTEPTASQHQIAECLSRLLGPDRTELADEIKRAATPVHLRSGEVLFRQGDTGDAMYIVVRGRLQISVTDEAAITRVVNEIARDQSCGEMSMFTKGQRTATAAAIRDSLLLKITREDFELLSGKYPKFALRLSNQVIERFSRSITGGPARTSMAINVAIVCASDLPTVTDFTSALVAALNTHGPTLRIDRHTVGAPEGSDFTAWLDQQEESHRFIVLIGNRSDPAWLDRVVQHADRIIELTPFSEWREGPSSPLPGTSAAQDQLTVLIHPERAPMPVDAGAKLKGQKRTSFEHVRDKNSVDPQRLARILAGKTRALVLGGGGARGFAHIGVYRAMEERGIPVDRVGGTSMGAIVGAQIAMGFDPDAIEERCREAFLAEPLTTDYTFPAISLLRGSKVDQKLQRFFEPYSIEDLWLPFFCVSANLTADATHVHENGLLSRALRASLSLPGIFPPVISAGDMLVDGGVLNNLPVDIMADFGGRHITAVNLEGRENLFQIEEERLPGGGEILLQRLRSAFGAKTPRTAPSLIEILTRSSRISSEQTRLRNQQRADIYLTLPLERFSLLEFSAFDEIIETAYEYTMREFDRRESNENVRP